MSGELLPTSLRGVIFVVLLAVAALLFYYASTTLTFLVGFGIVAVSAYLLYLTLYRLDNYLKHRM
ncbi:hypothetical protein C2R22_24535 (plasmid) [Salinigranum rubrum]|uniref:Uncharacterized protein n=1 Tax=Salinigranum rubrum TaxID=755307 RepID=A0A2I8VU39_9EURY|nr:hypothetical protein [Salinigranum rubrum]AUV84699.1 hypothetical protein C2R22_24535 [Salinigranum rubrum]